MVKQIKETSSAAWTHIRRFSFYVLIFWVLLSQYFAVKWMIEHSSSMSELLGTSKASQTSFEMSADELITIIAKEALKEAKK